MKEKMFNINLTYSQAIKEINASEDKVRTAAKLLHDRFYFWHIKPLMEMDNNAGFVLLNECFKLLDYLSHLEHGRLNISHYGDSRAKSFLQTKIKDDKLANSINHLLQQYFYFARTMDEYGVNPDLKAMSECSGNSYCGDEEIYSYLSVNPKILLSTIWGWFLEIFSYPDQYKNSILEFYENIGIDTMESYESNLKEGRIAEVQDSKDKYIMWGFTKLTWAQKREKFSLKNMV